MQCTVATVVWRAVPYLRCTLRALYCTIPTLDCIVRYCTEMGCLSPSVAWLPWLTPLGPRRPCERSAYGSSLDSRRAFSNSISCQTRRGGVKTCELSSRSAHEAPFTSRALLPNAVWSPPSRCFAIVALACRRAEQMRKGSPAHPVFIPSMRRAKERVNNCGESLVAKTGKPLP